VTPAFFGDHLVLAWLLVQPDAQRLLSIPALRRWSGPVGPNRAPSP